mmetsp:Transcript_25660/g.85660  ORF Transcript_25660/g.85660 Transcript_25660/m.85660 type:complete len:364 (+) Transcript_25660:67-1158(+)
MRWCLRLGGGSHPCIDSVDGSRRAPGHSMTVSRGTACSMAVMVSSERLLSPASSRVILLMGSALHSRSMPASVTLVSSICNSSSSEFASTSTRASMVPSAICVLSKWRMLILVCGSTFTMGTAPASLMVFLPNTSVVRADPGSVCANASICASFKLLSPTSSSVSPTLSDNSGRRGLMSVRRLPSRKSSLTCPRLLSTPMSFGRASSSNSLSPKSYLTTVAGNFCQNSAQQIGSMPGLLETPTPRICVTAKNMPSRVRAAASRLHPVKLSELSCCATRPTTSMTDASAAPTSMSTLPAATAWRMPSAESHQTTALSPSCAQRAVCSSTSMPPPAARRVAVGGGGAWSEEWLGGWTWANAIKNG